MSSPRESLASRMGFILLSAGCAIGLGNVWRFPFIVGRYGGCIFVLFYLLFLFIMGFPLLLTEVSIGRGSRKNLVHAMHDLAHTHKKTWATESSKSMQISASAAVPAQVSALLVLLQRINF